ncbi:MAG TPA: hypothetical protein VJS45_12595 [Acidimicrobiia bacterium]|nr:hypothetical protein [Acidimicrobiia bacterium]
MKRKTAPSNDAFGLLGSEAFAAYGTGTVLHSDPELSEGGDVTVDLAMADAVYAAQQLPAFTDELGRPIVTGFSGLTGQAHARAVNLDPPDAVGIDVDMGRPADSKAPPTGDPVRRETNTDLEPAVKADLLRAEAAARAVSSGCVIGDDLARAAASADDTDVGDMDFDPESKKPLASLSADEPGRAVSTTKSRTYLEPIPDRPGRFAAITELRQTIAPVTLGLPGVDEKFTLEVGGEWVMRASTDGTTGSVTSRPENSDYEERPAIRLLQDDELIAVGMGDLGDRTGIFIDGAPVGEIRIGGEPRAIFGRHGSKATETGTRVSAAGDMAVVRLFETAAELRIGHMEVGLAVPVGGVKCPGIGLTKISDPATIRPGDSFSWKLEVHNPNDCVLDKVRVTDSPTASRGVEWTAVTSIPRATRSPNGDLVFENIGALATGETRSLELNARVEPGSELGTITNRASAVGECGEAFLAGGAETTTNVGMAIVPALPRPPAGVPAGDGPSRRDSAGEAGSGESAYGPPTSGASSTPSGSNSRSASATRTSSATAIRSGSAARSGTSIGQGSQSAAAATASGAPLARSGADTVPHMALGLALLGLGRAVRLARVRRSA